MKVYVVTFGEYSDYHICGVAVDRERAELLKRYYSYTWREAEIEEYDTEEPVINVKPRKVFEIQVKNDGRVRQEGKQAWTYDENWEDIYRFYEFKNQRYLDFTATVVAEDLSHAVKKVTDMRAKMLAEKYGL